MTWRNRKLFNNLPQGIVSGLEPIPRYKEGGFVNPRNYIGGGTVEYPIGMEAGTLDNDKVAIVAYGVDMEAMGAFMGTPEFAERTSSIQTGVTLYNLQALPQ